MCVIFVCVSMQYKMCMYIHTYVNTVCLSSVPLQPYLTINVSFNICASIYPSSFNLPICLAYTIPIYLYMPTYLWASCPGVYLLRKHRTCI